MRWNVDFIELSLFSPIIAMITAIRFGFISIVGWIILELKFFANGKDALCEGASKLSLRLILTYFILLFQLASFFFQKIKTIVIFALWCLLF